MLPDRALRRLFVFTTALCCTPLVSDGQTKPKQPPDPLTEVKESLEQLEVEKRTLVRRYRELPAEIAKLKSKLKWLEAWQEADVVLGSATSGTVAALRREGEQYVLLRAAKSTDAVDAIGAARKSGVLRIANSQARDLANQLAASTREGQPVNERLASRMTSEIWKQLRFVAIDREVVDPPFVVYRDSAKDAQRVGLLVGQPAEDGFTINPVGAATRRVSRGDIRVGSVFVERGNEIIPALEEGASFLDYCALTAAHRLSTPKDTPGYVSLAVYVRFAMHSEIAAGEDRARRGFNVLELDGIHTPFVSLGIRTKIDFNTKASPALEKLRRQAEDLFYERLVELGVPVVEREHLDLIEKERQLLPARSDRDFADRLDATHVLVAEVEQSAGGSRCHTSVRLTDVKQGKIIWAASGDDTVPPAEDWSRFSVHGGQPVVASVKSLADAELSSLVESPRLIPIGNDAKTKRVPDDLLVIREPGDRNAPQLYRSLFQNAATPVSFSSAVKTVDSVNDVPRDQRYRFLVWQLGQRLLTPAGRILAVRTVDQTRHATVSLGADQHVEPGSHLRVLRQGLPTDSNHANDNPAEDVLLASTMRVTEVFKDRCTAIINASGLGGAWDERAIQPEIGDVVVSRFEPRKTVAVFPAQLRDPETPGERKAAKWDERNAQGVFGQRLECVKRLTAVRAKIRDDLRSGLEDLQLTVFQGEVDDPEKSCREAWQKGARVAIGGFVSAVDTQKMRYELQMVELQPHPSKVATIGRVLYSDKLEVPSLGLQQVGK